VGKNMVAREVILPKANFESMSSGAWPR
jgi:hypothetical protein